jgi:hypothetical protein
VFLFQGNFNRDQAFGTSKHQPQFLDGNKKRFEKEVHGLSTNAHSVTQWQMLKI